MESLEAEWANETYEETMNIFKPSEAYLRLTGRNKSPDSDKKVEKFKKFVFILYKFSLCTSKPSFEIA